MLTRAKMVEGFLFLSVFLLPWQTRWIYVSFPLNGQEWEYGKLSVYAVEVFIALVMLLRGRPRLVGTSIRIARAAVVFLGALFISFAFAPALSLSSAAALHMIAGAMLLFLLLDERTDKRKVTEAFVAGCILPSLLAWYQILSGASPASAWLGLASHDAQTAGASVIEYGTQRLLRGYGSFGHPNVFGGYLVIGLFMTLRLASLRHDERAKPKQSPREDCFGRLMCRARNDGLVVMASIVLPSVLILTFSRSAWLGLAAGLFIWAMLRWRSIKKIKQMHGWMWLLGFTSACFTVFIFNAAVFTRFDTSVRLEAKSMEERAQGYDDFEEVVRARWFAGVGVGAYTFELAKRIPHQPAWWYQPIHNTYLLLFAEMGLIGILAAMFFFSRVIKIALEQFRSRQGSVALGAIAALATIALFDHYLWSAWSGIALVCIVVSFAVHTTQKQNSKSNST